MPLPLILASGSVIRRALLENAGVTLEVHKARVDEEMIRAAMLAEGAIPRDIADALAEAKARKISDKHPGRLVLGCDQVLDYKGQVMSKARDVAEARAQLQTLRGTRHALLSAAVLYQDGKPLWRHIGQARLTMRPFSDVFLDQYLADHWDSVKDCVGCYKLEEFGPRLFVHIEGSHFNVLGLPLLELLNYLTLRGELAQ